MRNIQTSLSCRARCSNSRSNLRRMLDDHLNPRSSLILWVFKCTNRQLRDWVARRSNNMCKIREDSNWRYSNKIKNFHLREMSRTWNASNSMSRSRNWNVINPNCRWSNQTWMRNWVVPKKKTIDPRSNVMI